MRVTNYEALSQEDLFQGNGQSSLHDRSDLRSLAVKPETYYGEGPFDPPSSDEEADELLEKSSGAAERGRVGIEDDGHLVVGSKRSSSLRFLVIALVSLIALAAVIGVFAARAYTGTPFRIHGTKHITMDHVFNGTFYANSQSVHWVSEAGDGVYAISNNGYISLVDLKSNTTKNLVAFEDITDEHGRELLWSDWKLSSDMKYILLKADYLKQWRKSSFGNYYIHDLDHKETYPLIPPTYPPVTAYAEWSPVGQSIAYVMKNDLYIVPSPAPAASSIRITTSGNASLFHGVPDWVYEEEVFSADFALWWSPDAERVAYLRFDETAVDEYTFPVYNPSEDSYAVVPYPQETVMKYPKPGYNNPLVSVHVFRLGEYVKNNSTSHNATEAISTALLELDWEARQPLTNSIIQEVVWVANATLLLKEVNRAGNNGTVIIFDLNTAPENYGRVVRKLGMEGEHGDEGWIDAEQTVYPISSALSPDKAPSYLDIVPSASGYNHIALFSPATSNTPRFLTSGEWEVTGGILAVDEKQKLIYFQAANPSSIERHIYSIPLPTLSTSGPIEPTALTDHSAPGLFEAEFSKQGGFYLLSYRGPNVPWQRIVETGSKGINVLLTENPVLNDTLAQFEMPIVSYSTIVSDGYELNYIERRPPRMDDSGRTKYPVLFQVYGGPGSQRVDVSYAPSWHDYLACSLGYIVVTVDGRGTGYKGRKLRNPVKDNLGYWETQDQINAAKIWAAKDYVDSQRIGIWGWSYGGFMSSKVVEANAGVHSLSLAVAPVTSWRIYDSIYTERYMNTPEANPMGYVTASISNVTGFHNVDFLLAHGSGDDNVHYANSAHLLDMFTREKVRNYRFRMYTDSDHSILKRGANRELYEYMTDFLVEKWGKGARRRS